MTRAEAIDLCKNLKLFMEINDKLYANKFLESYHVALSMATNALSEVSEFQAINLDLASENENLLDQIQEVKAKTWIPVTERLPEDRRLVLVTAYWHETYQVMMASYYGDGLWWCVPFNNCGEHMQSLKPKAWMPLPEPYEEDKE